MLSPTCWAFCYPVGNSFHPSERISSLSEKEGEFNYLEPPSSDLREETSRSLREAGAALHFSPSCWWCWLLTLKTHGGPLAAIAPTVSVVYWRWGQTLLSVLDFSSSDILGPILCGMTLLFLHESCHRFRFKAKEKSKLFVANGDFDNSTVSPILNSTLFYEFSSPNKELTEYFWFFNNIL